MQSSLGNFFRMVADSCDRGCGVSPDEFEKVAKLQLRDHDDIQTLMKSVLILKREVDDLKSEPSTKSECKIIPLHDGQGTL